MSLMKVFSNPQKYRDLILKNLAIPSSKPKYSSKSFICVSFTRFCPVGCSFCFFSSSPAKKEKTIADALSEEGIEKFISFANDANLGYLLVSGGGEPFLEMNHLLRVVEEVKSDKIVLVTSGNWAKSANSAKNVVEKIYDSFKRRKSPTKLVIRLSVDLEHSRGRLGLGPAYNLISLFEEKYLEAKDFKLQFHTLFDDPCVDEILDKISGKILKITESKCQSDGETVLKVNPTERVVKFKSGMELKVGYAKVFYSNIKVNLNDSKRIQENLEVFQWDMRESEEHNPSIVTNFEGGKGLDFWVNFNGNVTTWGNQVPDNIYNLYEDSYVDVVEKTFADPISLAYIEKGDTYRDKIINEVNPRAVIRAKATNIRDYTGAIICEEEKTRLYLTLRISQDYLKEKRITEEHLTNLPKDITEAILAPVEELQCAYRASEFSIVDQYISMKSLQDLAWLDFLELIRLGHYDLTVPQIEKALNYYNNNVGKKKVESVFSVKSNPTGFFHEERIIAMKPSVQKKYLGSSKLSSLSISNAQV